MSRSHDAIYRQWLILQQIPRQPQSKSTAELHEVLREEGLEVERRTVQRDLERLSTLFPLCADPDGPGYRWSWLQDGAMVELPSMAPSTALTFLLARDHLAGFFPPSLMAFLAPYFQRAEGVLAESHLAHWREKVRLVHSGPDLDVPEVPEDVRDVVYSGLLEERQLEAGYFSRSRDSYGRRRIHPLGLVGRGGVYYLVARVDDKPEPRQLALHRMDGPALLDAPVAAPEGFDLDHYLQEQAAFSYPRNPECLALRLRVAEEVAFHLAERPLATDQEIEPEDGDTYAVRATVPDTEALRWWLLGFGPSVRVEGPEGLRGEMVRLTREAAAQYG
ncbi:hypothetical protein AN478_07285 [Thiohalorhabdus denitrificans]|uniref:Predicted DNA-binding transcriptional regulator YafY, contains an HTH and WYL domains n=1 Tax=Thiohalorhabdus denitrificans TaxID=381306 RepID=A0A0N8PMY0_9GAMM|nr:WYL domain-containing protein [Thiohalorhabdus denitrificans]KPV39981.1 hypothetical protein AN478_07285 [Thiohalorhabdus denitrificans]SCY10681.1 Predicted DNA-binding transcriptional regulator YafY, contains an HTH and WYL domains [Thiohalorhabdus denitrificans]